MFEFDDLNCGDCLNTRELAMLYEIALAMSNLVDIAASLEKALYILESKLHLKNCTVHTINDDSLLVVYACIGLNKFQRESSVYKIGEGVTGFAAESKEPVVIENIHNNMMFLNKTGSRDKNSISYIAVPMLLNQKLVGVLGANTTKITPNDFNSIVRVLTVISSIFAQAVESHNIILKEKEKLKELKLYYKMEWDSKVHNFGDIIGESSKMKAVYNIVERIAQSNVTVLIRGETGTGKELVAAAIHKRSNRKDEPFVKLNCAAIADTLIESELFGHERGAFTDAKEMRKGRFELADGGTLFLDEIGDISASAQVKLLRVLQEREFERVGGNKTIKVNVRLIAATNRNLENMVEKGLFREDLYYRLNVIPIDLPPLRERGDDIALLVNFFLKKSMNNHKKKVIITDEAMDILCQYSWPGNVRELENTVERIVLMGSEYGISADEMLLLLPAFNQKLMCQRRIFSSENEV